MFFQFFAQEINIAKDILVKPAVARLPAPVFVSTQVAQAQVAEPRRDRMASGTKTGRLRLRGSYRLRLS